MPTKLVTLKPGSVAEKLPAETANGDCWARFSELDVTHGVTELALVPLKVMFTGTAPPFWLIATITNAPVLAFLYAVTRTLTGAPVVPSPCNLGARTLKCHRPRASFAGSYP